MPGIRYIAVLCLAAVPLSLAQAQYPDPNETLQQSEPEAPRGLPVRCEDGTVYALAFGPNGAHLTVVQNGSTVAALVRSKAENGVWSGAGWEVRDGGDSYAITAPGKTKTICIAKA